MNMQKTENEENLRNYKNCFNEMVSAYFYHQIIKNYIFLQVQVEKRKKEQIENKKDVNEEMVIKSNYISY